MDYSATRFARLRFQVYICTEWVHSTANSMSFLMHYYIYLPPTDSDEESEILPAKKKGGRSEWIWLPPTTNKLDADEVDIGGKSSDDWLIHACHVLCSYE